MIRTIAPGSALIAIVFGAAVVAHEGVKNPAVKARMDSMSRIGAATKTLGQMAQGKVSFDADAARAAAHAMAREAGQIPQYFKAPETDPMSEARPAIWTDFKDFSDRAGELEGIALQIAGVSSQQGLRRAMGDIGRSCKGCHELYRD